jgi:DNA-binding response OmpR family regulator
VLPGAVPDGAIVLGIVVALPAGQHEATTRPIRQLVAVPARAATRGRNGAAEPGPGSESGILQLGRGLVMDRWAREVTRDGDPLTLTRREFELLQHLVTRPGRVFTRQQLLAAVWDITDTPHAPARTVDVHISRLRRKLGATHSPALESLRGVGYRWTARSKATLDDPS